MSGTDTGKRLRSWASIIDPKTQAQAELTATMPFIDPWLALMPDAHLGKGATVGSVIPTVGAIMPAAVGVDIGCGMIAVRTRWTSSEIAGNPRLSELREEIERAIPLSAGRYNSRIVETAEKRIAELEAMAQRNYDLVAGNWRLQLGTLGSGNHFIEVTADEEGRVWLFLHSGSRGIGNRLANEHIRVAQEETGSQVPDRDLAWLTEGTKTFDAYIRDLRWAQHFALLNREEMMVRVIRQFMEWCDGDAGIDMEINCHHNFTEQEEHYGKTVWLSRKGAIQADKGQLGLIPGSMGTASYIVEGLGNKEAFNSAPHGAGRVHSRTSARKTFTLEQLDEAMQGIEYRRTAAFLDEHPLAYKDIDVVMRDAATLVRPLHVLHQLLNVKGD